MFPRLRKFLKILSVAAVLVGAWVAYDLYSPRTAHLRQFDPDEVARLETAMWRSYYAPVVAIASRGRQYDCVAYKGGTESGKTAFSSP